jgi:hypothetical protein
MLLNRDQIAERLGTTPGVAANILSEHGVKPVDLGRGRGRGKRWYASAVDAVMYQMHEDAQGKQKTLLRVHTGPYLVRGKTAKQVYAELTKAMPAQ